jgi:hypothetical protein
MLERRPPFYCPVCNTRYEHSGVCSSCGYDHLMPQPSRVDRVVLATIDELPLIGWSLLLLIGATICTLTLTGVYGDWIRDYRPELAGTARLEFSQGLALVIGACITIPALVHIIRHRDYLLTFR